MERALSLAPANEACLSERGHSFHRFQPTARDGRPAARCVRKQTISLASPIHSGEKADQLETALRSHRSEQKRTNRTLPPFSTKCARVEVVL